MATADHSEGSARWRARLAHALRGLFVVVVAGTLAWYSATSRISRDLTNAQSHTLSAASRSILETFTGPLRITAYLSPRHTWRQQVKHLIGRYTRYKPDIDFTFVDPAGDPEQIRAEDIRDGEILITSGKRTERTNVYTEQAVTEALARLSRAEASWIVFVSGHGERSPRRGANYDVSDWATVLEKRGFNVQEINLVEYQIPDNTGVLVVASPQVDYETAELAAIKSYVDRGGNLLWLVEPDTPPKLRAFGKTIGVEQVPGTVVDPVTLAHGIDNPAFILLSRYAAHPALKGFDYTSVLFFASAILDRPEEGWTGERLILSSDQAWSETGALEGNVGYDEGRDFMGPLPLAIALSRRVGGHEQRIVVVGDGDFLANTYLQNSGNQDLGVRLVEWLSRNDTLIELPSRTADDRLELEDWHQAVIGFTFLFALPGAFALNGLLIWLRRRRA